MSLPALAYAHYVLARAKSDDLGALRYFNDTEMAELPTQLAKAQLGAALAAYGDATRAAAAYAAALAPPPKRPLGLRFVDYGSDLRDSAAALAYAAADPGSQGRLTTIMDRIAELFAKADRTSTQEQAWLLLAAEAAAKLTGNSMTIAADDKASETRSTAEYFRRVLGAGAPALSVANRGAQPLWRSVSITGVASTPTASPTRRKSSHISASEAGFSATSSGALARRDAMDRSTSRRLTAQTSH